LPNAFLLDTNLIIESMGPEAFALRAWIAAHRPAVSAATLVEALRYPHLTKKHRADFEALFASLEVLPTTDAVISKADELRRRKPMSPGDALIASTALLHNRILLTKNLKDFQSIPGLTVHGPPTEDPS